MYKTLLQKFHYDYSPCDGCSGCSSYKKKKKAHSAYLSLLFFNWMADVSSKKKSDSRLINKYDYLKFFRNYFT